MSITKATCVTDIWNTIYNHLQTGSYAISTNNIFSAWNSKLAKDTGYPLVILFPPHVSFNKTDLHGNITDSKVVENIEVYNTSAANLKSLVDEVCNKLLTGRKVFSAVRLMNMNITSMDFDDWEEENKRIHRCTMVMEFNYST